MSNAQVLQNVSQLSLFAVLVGFAVVLAACGANPVIARVDGDTVEVQANGAILEQARLEAQEACSLRNLWATLTTFRCDARHCLQGTYVFTCTPRSEVK